MLIALALGFTLGALAVAELFAFGYLYLYDNHTVRIGE